MSFAAPPSSIGALRRRHGFVVAALVIIVVGCATLTPQEQDTVADVQHFADGTATAYNLPQIRVTIEPATNLGIGGRYRQGNFYLNARTLGSGTPPRSWPTSWRITSWDMSRCPGRQWQSFSGHRNCANSTPT